MGACFELCSQSDLRSAALRFSRQADGFVIGNRSETWARRLAALFHREIVQQVIGRSEFPDGSIDSGARRLCRLLLLNRRLRTELTPVSSCLSIQQQGNQNWARCCCEVPRHVHGAKQLRGYDRGRYRCWWRKHRGLPWRRSRPCGVHAGR